MLQFKNQDATWSECDVVVVSRNAAGEIAKQLNVHHALEPTLAGTKAKPGAVARVFRAGRPSVLLVIGGREPAGADKPKPAAAFEKDMAAAAGALREIDVGSAALLLDSFEVEDHDAYWKTRAALAAMSTASYRLTAYKTKPQEAPKWREVGIHVGASESASATRAVSHAEALHAGLIFAKDLANQPPNVCDPRFVATQARSLAESARSNVSVEVVDKAEMESLGMAAFLAVARGSAKEPTMSVVKYQGGGPNDAPIVLIGKGITFDSGGINLKPTTGTTMGEMKFDMCGAAAVLGAVKAAALAALPLNVIAIAAAAENMPGGRASRPSDIVKTMSGKTVEILNTDAEGRLVLCDALTYAERFKPAVVVDVATLTGAQVIALGHHASALYSENKKLAESLVAAGEKVHDRIWRMPLWDEYQDALKSKFADMKNVGPTAAGSITAACFLSRFAGNFNWAHLDVAGTAYDSKEERGTGRPTPALFQFLLDRAGSS